MDRDPTPEGASGATGVAEGADPREICSLAPDALEERIAWIRSEILVHAVACHRLPDGVAWELEAVPGLEARLDQLVELEGACCAPLRFTHLPGVGPARRRLEVRGLDAGSIERLAAG